ncbi:DUF6912 family protein [Propionibacteriaceae bacterium Y1923]
MGSILVCIPARRDSPDALFSGPVEAITPNAALRSSLDYTDDMTEEADYAALVLASVWALARHGERFVVTAEVDASQVAPGPEAANGGVLVTGLARRQLVAWFDDAEPGIADGAADAVRGLDIDQAWADEQVSALLEHELLWHTIEEWGT